MKGPCTEGPFGLADTEMASWTKPAKSSSDWRPLHRGADRSRVLVSNQGTRRYELRVAAGPRASPPTRWWWLPRQDSNLIFPSNSRACCLVHFGGMASRALGRTRTCISAVGGRCRVRWTTRARGGSPGTRTPHPSLKRRLLWPDELATRGGCRIRTCATLARRPPFSRRLPCRTRPNLPGRACPGRTRTCTSSRTHGFEPCASAVPPQGPCSCAARRGFEPRSPRSERGVHADWTNGHRVGARPAPGPGLEPGLDGSKIRRAADYTNRDRGAASLSRDSNPVLPLTRRVLGLLS